MQPIQARCPGHRPPFGRYPECGARQIRAGVRRHATGAELPPQGPAGLDRWRFYLRAQYRLIRILGRWRGQFWRGYGLGNVVELHVPGRRTGRDRPVLLGLLRSDGDWFLGHPNGETAWTRNLAAAGGGRLTLSWPTSILDITARRLEPGEERDRAILATGQHVFPGNIVYRLARRHIRAVGAYFAIEATNAGEPVEAVTET